WTNGIFQLFGRTPDEFIVSFDTFLECVHPGDRQHLNDAIAACVKKDEEYDIEHRVILPDGTVRWVSEKGGVTRDEQGNATRMLGIVQDISEKRKVEERLRLLSQAVENNPALIIVTDPKGDIEYVNPKFTEITGYTMEEAIGQNPRILKSGWTHSNDYRNMWQTISSGKEWRGEVYNKNKKGDHYWAQVSISPVMDDMGFIKHYIGLQEDVTSKKSVEIALRNSETKMRLITDNIPASIAFIDIEQRHLFTNRAYNELIQMSADEINLLPVKELGPEISPKFVLKLHEALNGHNVSFEYKFKRDQKSTYLNADYIPHFVDGKVEGVFVLIIDITERKKMEKDLRIAKEQAEQANLAKSTFLASMSHELRTPLNSILGFAQILKSNIKNNLSEKELGYASHILSSGDLLLQLINEVLDLSKIESGKFDLFMEPELLKHVFLETIDQIMAIAYKYKIDVTYLDENLDHYVLVDKKIIRQILMNLLSNAIKYNRAEGNVTLSCKIVDQNFAQIEVLDTGYGIAKENMSKLFDPFCRLGAESKDIEGTGIGLTITKRLVEQLGGSISVKSEVGKGTSFFVTFPLTEQPSLQEKQKEGDFVNPINISEKPLKTILYIEDNNVNLKLVESILEFHQEIKLISAGSAEKGLELAKAHLPDIILMDINLPGMNGIEALANLRNLKSTREIPVVAVTAKAMIEDVEIGKGAGFDGYVTKPIQVVEFKQIIDNLLFDKR
ncbi:PAS domain S-box protein, partial [bacterium]|nr:PAS domain S-box protein [bacterium]